MLKTAEAVSPAHPDKIADQISDLILTEALKQDKKSRIAIETMGGHRKIYIVGEMTTKAKLNIEELAKKVLRDNRYNDNYEVFINIAKQSKNIAKGVDIGGAGDQGIMIGYACNDNEDMIPEELYLSRKILKELWKNPKCRDAKSQVTIDNGKVSKVVLSAERLRNLESVIEKIVGKGNYEMLINPAGYWDNGGFEADSGLTGRKIVYDAYGPQVEIGGGCFSGKDFTKVDRSGAYMARKLAVEKLKQYNDPNYVDARGFKFKPKWVKIKVAYAIGIAEPVMITIGTDLDTSIDITDDYKERFKPSNIIKELDLMNVDYYQVAKWGSFGNNFNWDE